MLQTLSFCHKTKGRGKKKKRATRRRNRKHVFFSSHLVRLLAQSDSSCFFQPGVFGVERVHTIPEQEEDLHMKRGKIIFYLSNRNSDRGLWASLPACCWRWSSQRKKWSNWRNSTAWWPTLFTACTVRRSDVLQVSSLEVFAAQTAALSSVIIML